nr:hypothetical protein [Tanacetum cinerariifolium]
YGETVTLKRRRDDDEDKDEEPSAGPDRGSKRRREDKEPVSASESALAEEPVQTTSQMEEPLHPEFDTGTDDQPIIQSSQYPEWFSQPQKLPTLDHDWNKTLPAVHGSIQPWISELAKQDDTRSSFNELMDTPLDFFNFIMNRLRVDTLTPELLAGPTYDLMKGSCKSLIELEYHPLTLMPDNQGRRVIPFAHFINNDLEYHRRAMPFHNLEFRDSNDSSLGIYIASRLPVNSETVKLLTFMPPVGDSPECMLVVVYWFLYPHSPKHQVFNPLNMPVICCLCGD